MAEDDATRFPSGITKVGAQYKHPVTGQTYVYAGTTKRSWRLTGDVETRTYTGANSPQDENLRHGDLWWDTEFYELRVYNQVPIRKNPNGEKEVEYSEGVWISSTHPMMDPDDPNQMKQFGPIICTPTNRVIIEGSEFKFVAHLPHSSVPLDEWEVSAIVSPSYIGGDSTQSSTQNKVSVYLDPDTGEIKGNLITGLYPIGDVPDSSRRLRVTITVQARTGEEDEFYERFYLTSTKGGFSAEIETRPTMPPLIVKTLPFNEIAIDSIRAHVNDVDFWKEADGGKYLSTVNTTTRFEHPDPGVNGELALKSRIDGNTEGYNDVDYPMFDELPRVALDLKTSGARVVTLLFKYGVTGDQPLDEAKPEYYNDVSDNYGTVDPSWQSEFTSLGTVQALAESYRLTFYYDGEDNNNSSDNRWTSKFEDMGVVSEVYNDDNPNEPFKGYFIGLRLTGENTTRLFENTDGTRRLYFALVNTGTDPFGDVRDIVPTSKGYIDIEALT